MKKNDVLEVTKDIKWIGILDPDIRTFDVVMETKYGTTYNSYFINADKKAIIETSKAKFDDAYIEKVKAVVDPKEVEYIVLNHTEPDHSGSLKRLLELAPNATVVGTKAAINFLKHLVNNDFKYQEVKDNDEIDLGNKTLKFIAAPFLHWPDTMFTYLKEDNVLFPCDAFGCHYCDERMFNDLVGNFDESFKYYFEVIMKPFSSYMLSAIGKIKDLDIDVICPGHGPILRENPRKYIDMSESMCTKPSNIDDKYILIPFVSAYGYTKKMAQEIAIGMKDADGDIKVEVLDIEEVDLTELGGKIEKCAGLVVGCPTINQNILLPIYNLFAILNPITNKGKQAAAFGSYGWSGEAVKIMEDNLKNHKLKIALDGLRVMFLPEKSAIDKCREFGGQFVNILNNK